MLQSQIEDIDHIDPAENLCQDSSQLHGFCLIISVCLTFLLVKCGSVISVCDSSHGILCFIILTYKSMPGFLSLLWSARWWSAQHIYSKCPSSFTNSLGSTFAGKAMNYPSDFFFLLVTHYLCLRLVALGVWIHNSPIVSRIQLYPKE